mmetsp:Transcript_37721/g.116567  ORF Transcript_37721/g.116567 Transcript_37721/m.116567 type:complete len:301 (-) Transcript_37721:312-1214(-)
MWEGGRKRAQQSEPAPHMPRRAAFMISSTSSSCAAMTPAVSHRDFFTFRLSRMPRAAGSHAAPVSRSRPAYVPGVHLRNASCTSMIDCWTSWPLFSARVFGITSSASAYARTPSFCLPVMPESLYFMRWSWSATSKAPAPGTTARCSSAYLTARRPSRVASLSCAMVWSLAPRMSIVTERACLTCSMKVYFSSPSVTSCTRPASPSASGPRFSNELTASPPAASARRSMLRFLARRTAKMPSLASISSAIGSMPFWLTTTNVLPFSFVHTSRLSAMTCLTLSSVTLRSASAILAFCSGEV